MYFNELLTNKFNDFTDCQILKITTNYAIM
jgi:hypothetical protein